MAGRYMTADELYIPDASIEKLMESLSDDVPRELTHSKSVVSHNPYFQESVPPVAKQEMPMSSSDSRTRHPLRTVVLVALALVVGFVFFKNNSRRSDIGITTKQESTATQTVKPAQKPDKTSSSVKDSRAIRLSSAYLLKQPDYSILADLLGCKDINKTQDQTLELVTDKSVDELLSGLESFFVQTLEELPSADYIHFISASVSDDYSEFVIVVNALDMSVKEREAVNKLLQGATAYAELCGAGADKPAQVVFNNMLGNTVRVMSTTD